jgi:hypothetical protein
MKQKIRSIAAALAAFFMLPLLSLTALAAPEDFTEDVSISAEAPIYEEVPAPEEAPATTEAPSAPVTDYPETPPRPFTPAGTGAVIDTATDSDGKVFYTITTPDEHIFYLVIDTLRSTENVYFLNAVTIADLAALAEIPAMTPGGTITPAPPTTEPSEQPTKTPPPAEQPQGGGNMGIYIFIIVLAVAGGGAGWCFKICRPKQQSEASGDEYDPSMDDTENGDIDDWGDQDEADDNLPWDEDALSQGGESEDDE